jgi:uncharacterized protein (TIGR02391 family)
LSFATTLRRIGGDVVLVRQGPEGERRTTVLASVQNRKAQFTIDTDVEEGDIIEQTLPNGVRRYEITHVTFHAQGPQNMRHIVAEFKVAGAPRRPVVVPRRIGLPGLHPSVSAAAGGLFEDGHASRAVFAAFQAVEHRVQELTGRSESGKGLMMTVFNEQQPALDVSRYDGRSGQDEREGFKFLFSGAILALRNPRGHGPEVADDPEEAMEYLALASLLMRRLDDAASRVR